jgi:hypothetical protein
MELKAEGGHEASPFSLLFVFCVEWFFFFVCVFIVQVRSFIVVFPYMHIIYFDHIYPLSYSFLIHPPTFNFVIIFFYGFHYDLFICTTYNVLQSYSHLPPCPLPLISPLHK